MTQSPIYSAKTGQVVGWLDEPDEVPPTPEEILASERAAMVCTPARMRLALYRMGLLQQVQAIADRDPEASIVWEYATRIKRNDPFIEALGTEAFTAEEIDDLFREAMKL